MRVTNGMLMNNTLNGLYKNMNNMNKLYGQMTTGKKIQTVSDNPVIAGRALKLKTTVLETEQYESNAKEAASWMDITEVALDNITSIMKEIRTKIVQGANSTLEEEDKLAIKTDIAQLYEQVLQEVNTTYDGRYIFSGYKTNQPVALPKETTLDEDVTVNKDMSIPSGTDIKEGSTIKDGSTLALDTVLGVGTTIPGGSTLTTGTTLSADEAQSLLGITLSDTTYTLDADYTIPSGTKISEAAALELGIDANHAVIYEDAATNTKTYMINEGGFTISKDTTLTKDTAEEVLDVTVSKDSYTITADITVANATTLKGAMTLGADCKMNGDVVLQGESSLGSGTVLAKDSVLLAGTTLPKGAFNPKVYGLTDGQSIAYEVGTNNTIDVNVLGMDSVVSDLLASLGAIYTAVDASLNGDSNYTTEALYDVFNDAIGKMDKHLADVSEKVADLGSRMARVDYVQNRLVDQETTFKSLLSETEDIDIEEVYVEFNVQYATYQSALQATSKIITNTLADYL